MKFYAAIPEASITETSVEVHKTFLDTIGRTALTIKARNLVDDFRDRELIVSYDVPFMASVRKPIIVFVSMVSVFVATWALGSVDMKFSSK
ncbi:MAG: dolichyl-diphosphooligosaccharide--protein glycosyltransferase subunit 1 [Thaumarchaeota archaeon]|nr:dolichyl-diphosphooligosaccharide--protein glycosyltransferase subunit 1 [Nitrososphaerota archaeon]